MLLLACIYTLTYFLLDCPTSFSFYASVVVSLNKIFQFNFSFNSIQILDFQFNACVEIFWKYFPPDNRLSKNGHFSDQKDF